jgi:hypothetical protein
MSDKKGLTCRDIIVRELKAMGADGLCDPVNECACKMDDLIPYIECKVDNCSAGRLVDGEWVECEDKRVSHGFVIVNRDDAYIREPRMSFKSAEAKLPVLQLSRCHICELVEVPK